MASVSQQALLSAIEATPAVPPSYTYVGLTGNTLGAASSTVPFTGIVVPAGLLVVMASARSGSSRTINNVRVDGVNMSIADKSSSTTHPSGIFYKVMESGDTVDIDILTSGNVTNGVIDVIVLHDLASTTPIDDDTIIEASGTTEGLPLDLTLDAIALWMIGRQGNEDTSWSNATELSDHSEGVNLQHSAALHQATTAETRTGTASWTTPTNGSMCAAAWR